MGRGEVRQGKVWGSEWVGSLLKCHTIKWICDNRNLMILAVIRS